MIVTPHVPDAVPWTTNRPAACSVELVAQIPPVDPSEKGPGDVGVGGVEVRKVAGYGIPMTSMWALGAIVEEQYPRRRARSRLHRVKSLVLTVGQVVVRQDPVTGVDPGSWATRFGSSLALP